MSASIRVERTRGHLDRSRWAGWPAVFAGICATAAITFLLLPWSIEGKSLAVLHGLCAQQPDHSFYFGDQRLPFDARMTGIYGGFACSVAYLLARGRWRAAGVPSIALMVALAFFIVALGIDGVNSTLRDLGVWHAYQPHNAARLATGLLTGTTLAVFIWMLVGQIALAPGARSKRRPIGGFRDLGLLLVVEACYAALVFSRVSILRIPLTFVLLASAVAVLTGLSLAFVLLIGRRENRAHSAWDLAGPATIALIAALLIIGATGGGRFLLEDWLDIPPAVRGGA